MSSSTSAVCGHSHQHNHAPKVGAGSFNYMEMLTKISSVALGVFAAYVRFSYFVPSFIAGMLMGIHGYTQDKNPHWDVHSFSSCALGFMGVKLPAPVGLAADVAVALCHIDHHANVFVPIAGVSMGIIAGRKAAHYADLANHKFSKPATAT